MALCDQAAASFIAKASSVGPFCIITPLCTLVRHCCLCNFLLQHSSVQPTASWFYSATLLNHYCLQVYVPELQAAAQDLDLEDPDVAWEEFGRSILARQPLQEPKESKGNCLGTCWVQISSGHNEGLWEMGNARVLWWCLDCRVVCWPCSCDSCQTSTCT